MGFCKSLQIWLLYFYARGCICKCFISDKMFLFKICGWISKKEKWFTNKGGDGMPMLRPIFPEVTGINEVDLKINCFGHSCWSVEKLQWFAALDFVLI